MTGLGTLVCAALFTLSDTTVTIHRVEADVVPSGIIQTNSYLREGGTSGEPMRTSTTLRLKYTQMQGGQPSKVGAYHGIGVYNRCSRVNGSGYISPSISLWSV